MTSYHRSIIIIAVVIPLFLSCLHSQTQNEPFSDEKTGKEYYIQRTLEKPMIDGKLDDPAWSTILPISDFLQEDPDNMEEPTEKTEVYLIYDDKSIYIAARLYDSKPSEIVQQLAPQDDWYSAFFEMADWFSIALDSRHDHQTGFAFFVNASGVIYDEMIYNDQEKDEDWDGIWEAEVNIDELGWSVEIAIPFSNLSFFKGDELTWGMNITRFIQRNYETITWVTFSNDIEGISSKYGHLNGLQGIYPPAKFKFVPNFFGSTTNYSDIRLLKSYGESYEPRGHKLYYIDDPMINLGIDISYRLNPSSNLMMTINPDFNQVEADPANVNNSAYKTYFPEKRPFFLKDVDIFKTPIEIYYSRRIGGIWEDLVIVDTTTIIDTTQLSPVIDTTWIDTTHDFQQIQYKIKTAGKWTGKTKRGLSYGLLGAITTPKWPEWNSILSNFRSDWIKQENKSKDKNYFVSRIKQDLFSGNSFIGFMSTSSMENSAHTFSVDGMANIIDNQIGIDGQIIMTSDKHKGIFGSMSYSPLGFFSGWIEYYQYDKGLELNDLGFLDRDDFTQTKIGLMFQSFEPWNIVRNSTIMLQGNIEENSEGLNLEKSIALSYDMMFTNFWNIGGGFKRFMESYDDREIYTYNDIESLTCCPSIALPEVDEISINVSSDQHQSISAFTSVKWQKSASNETSIGQFTELVFKPNSYLHFATSYSSLRLMIQNHFLEAFPEETIDSSYHYIFSNWDGKNDILTFRANVNFNRKLSFQGYLELFSNRDYYSNYVEYLPSTNEFEEGTPFILGEDPFITIKEIPMPVYTTSIDTVDLIYSYVDPNYELDFRPNLTSMRFNGVLKWNYMKGSNFYLIYIFNKAVNGHKFDSISQLSDFFTFNKYEPWVEVRRDQTVMIKIDYWFEK